MARKGDKGPPDEPFTSFTQGNVFWDGVSARPSEREMVMVPFNNFYCQWADIGHAGLYLAYFDGNVRGTAQLDWPADPNNPASFGPPNISIFPNVDGVVNSDQHDYNDQAKIEGNLACSLSQNCPP